MVDKNFNLAQQQIALDSLGLISQSIEASLNAQRQSSALSAQEAQLALVDKYALALEAIQVQEEQIDVTRNIQNFQNEQFNRQFFSTLQNLTNFKKSVKLNIEQSDKIAASRVGKAKAQVAAAGVISTEGSAQDFITQVVNESERDSKNLYMDAYNKTVQVQEELLNVRAQQVVNNFNIDTQINFNVKELERRLRFI